MGSLEVIVAFLVVVLLVIMAVIGVIILAEKSEKENLDQYQIQLPNFDNNTINLTINKSHIVSISEDEMYYYFKMKITL